MDSYTDTSKSEPSDETNARAMQESRHAEEDWQREQERIRDEATSKAAAAMGRAGRGASKVRGGSDHYRAIRAKRPAPQVYESRDEWGGYTVREGHKGWMVEVWSARSGERSGWRACVAYGAPFARDLDLDAPASDYPGAPSEAECIVHHAADAIRARALPGQTPILGVRVLSRGHIVR